MTRVLALVTLTIVLARAAAYPGGVDSCTLTPGHGGALQTTQLPTLTLTQFGSAVTTYQPGVTYALSLSAVNRYRGFTMQPFAGSSVPGSPWAATLGSLTVNGGDTSTRASSSCSNQVTHTGNAQKTSTAVTWTAPGAGSGPVTFVATVVECATCGGAGNLNRRAVLTIAESVPSPAASPSSAESPSSTASVLPSSTATPSTTVSAASTSSVTPSLTATATGSPTTGLSTSPSSSVPPSTTPSSSVPPSSSVSPSRPASSSPSPSISPTSSVSASPRPAVVCPSACSGRGRCLSSAVCACDVGYAGAACASCAVGYSPASTSAPSVCTLVAGAQTILTSTISMNLTAQRFDATTASQLETEIASTLQISRQRVATLSFTSSGGIVSVRVSIAPPSQSNAQELDAPTAALQWQLQAVNASSSLRSRPLSSAVDPTSALRSVSAPFLPPTYSVPLSPQLTFSWRVDAMFLYGTVTHADPSIGWFAVGFNSAARMPGTDAIVFERGSAGQSSVLQHTLSGRSLSSVTRVSTPHLVASTASLSASNVSMSFIRPLQAGVYSGSVDLSSGGQGNNIFVVHASGMSTSISMHSQSGAGSINLASGSFVAVGVIQPWHVAHGVLMFLSCGVAFPVGAALARFAKRVAPVAGPAAFWFRSHWLVQVGGALGMLLAFIIAVASMPTMMHFTSTHHRLGLFVVLLALLQAAGGAARPKKQESDKQPTMTRVVWEALHKCGGYVIIVSAAVSIFLGLERMADLSASEAAMFASLRTAYAVVLAVAATAFIAAAAWQCCFGVGGVMGGKGGPIELWPSVTLVRPPPQADSVSTHHVTRGNSHLPIAPAATADARDRINHWTRAAFMSKRAPSVNGKRRG